MKRLLKILKRFLVFNKQYDFYLAGAMSGCKDHNYPVFMKYANILRQLGYTICNPAELNVIGTPSNECMTNDLNAIINQCKNVVLLPGSIWRNSVGVNIEVSVAHVCGKRVYHIFENKSGSITLKRFYTKDIRPYCNNKNKYRNDSAYIKFLNSLD